MAKENGIGMTFTIDDSGDSAQTIENDITNVDWTMPRAFQDSTGLDSSATERLGLLTDFTCNPSGIFNDAAGASHAVYKDHNTTTQIRDLAIAISGQTLTINVWPTDYSMTRAQSGEFTWSGPLVLADGTAAAWS